MASYPMYILVPAEDYDGNDWTPSDNSIYEEPDFQGIFGSEGYISVREQDEAKLNDGAMELEHFFGSDICHADGNTIVFVNDAPWVYAKRKLDMLEKAVNDMTVDQFLYNGQWELKNTFYNQFVFVHTCGENCSDSYIQSADRFVLRTLYDDPCRKYVVAEIVYCHD